MWFLMELYYGELLFLTLLGAEGGMDGFHGPWSQKTYTLRQYLHRLVYFYLKKWNAMKCKKRLSH